MGAEETDEFNVLQFEKKLTCLKDSQDSINLCCQWCLSNRKHHKKIVNSWLNVLKRVKVEHRLVLFYLANDVIQYSKRKKYEYVESWGTALQKATTLVRDDRVKQKIVRIFKIWEDRGIYSEEFIADLCGLISATPTAPKGDETHEFRPSFVINKIRVCANLETDTDAKLIKLNELNSKVIEMDTYYTTLKDRAQLDEAEKEVDVFAKHMEDYVNALKAEIKNRISLISVLRQADEQLETDRKDVKIVGNAYKSFGVRVKAVQKKLEEHKATLSSPIPSPDVNAPSPTSDTDIDLPEDDVVIPVQEDNNSVHRLNEFDLSSVQITAPNYYTPVPAPTASNPSDSSGYPPNGFTSFMGSNLQFDVQNFTTNSTSSIQTATFDSMPVQTTIISQQPPPPPPKTQEHYQYSVESHSGPLLPPPMPPFGGKEDSSFDKSESVYDPETAPDYSTAPFDSSYSSTIYDTSQNNSSYNEFPQQSSVQPFETPVGANPYPPVVDNLPTYGNLDWLQSSTSSLDNLDTPESPPPFEKEAFGSRTIEYHDNAVSVGIADVDHRVLPSASSVKEKKMGRAMDVDHRNLISLIGSPADTNSNNNITTNDMWSSRGDQDYRQQHPSLSLSSGGDQDYRLPLSIEQLKLPPPPPPPSSTTANKFKQTSIPVAFNMNNNTKMGSSPFVPPNVENIDMDMSDDDGIEGKRENLKVVVGFEDYGTPESEMSEQNVTRMSMLQPPPPLPEFPDDVEENLFLDQIDSEINDFLINPEETEKNVQEDEWKNSVDQQQYQNNVNNNNRFQQHFNDQSQQMYISPPPMIPPQHSWNNEQNQSFNEGFNNPQHTFYGQRGRNFKRGKFQNDRGGFNDQKFNHWSGGGNNFRGRGGGWGGPRFQRGNFRGL